MTSVPRVLVIGVGNDYRGDDAVGLAVARRLRESPLLRVDVIEATGEGGRLIEAWTGYGAVVIVDAMRSTAAAGTVRRVDVTSEPAPAYFSHRSTHAIGVIDAVEMARAMGRLPGPVVLFGIEGAHYDAGTDLSPQVAAAVPAAVEVVGREARQLLETIGASAHA